jgi:cytidylate kinase
MIEKHADLVLEKGLEVYLDELYEAKAFRSVLIAEIVRFVTAQETAHRVLYHEDIDLTKMNNLAKVEEEQHKNRYLSYAEQQKHKEK